MAKLRHNLIKNYLFEFLKYSNVMHIFWFVYLLSKGFTVVEVALLESIFHITSLIFETPTGAIADVLGRKYTRMMGMLFHILYLIGLWYVSSYGVAVISFILAAISYNLESGSATAFVYDTLKEIGEETTFTQRESFRESLIRIASVLGNLGGGLLIALSYGWAFLVNIITYLIAIGIALTFQETTVQKRKEKKVFQLAFIQQFQESIQLFKKNIPLFFAMVAFALISTMTAVLAYYATVYWESLQWSSSIIGFWFAAGGVLAALGAFLSHRIEKRVSLQAILWINVILTSLGFGFFFFPYVSIIGFLVLSFLDGGLYVLMNALLNRFTQSEIRATVLSINSMFFSLFMMVLFPLFGAFIQFWTFEMSFIVFALGWSLIMILLVPQASLKTTNKI